MATPVKSGYSDFGQNWKVRKTCCFCYKLIVFMKEQNIECFRRIGRVFSTFQKILKMNRKMATPVRSGYSDFGQNWSVRQNMPFFFFKLIVFMNDQNFEGFRKNWKGIFNISKNTQNHLKNRPRRLGPDTAILVENWKVRKNMLFFLQTDCFDERTTSWMFQKNWKGIFNNSKNQLKKINQQNGHTGKALDTAILVKIEKFPRKYAFFFFKLTVFMKEQNFECFRRIGRVFSTFQKINSKKSINKMATPVRSGYSDFGPNWKVPETCLFFLQTDCFHERTKFWMFQKNWKGIFNISKNQPKKSTNKTKWPRR